MILAVVLDSASQSDEAPPAIPLHAEALDSASLTDEAQSAVAQHSEALDSASLSDEAQSARHLLGVKGGPAFALAISTDEKQ